MDVGLQRLADAAKGLQRHIVLGRFNPAQVGSLHPAPVCDRLDGQALGLAYFAKSSAEFTDEGVVVRHE